MFTLDPGSENVLSILGAMFDIAGAILIAKALVFVKVKHLMRQSTSGYSGISSPLIKMFSDQWVDGSYGLALLLFGFTLQGAAGYGYKSSSNCLLGVGTAGLGIIVLVYFLTRRSMTEWKFKRACRTQYLPDGAPTWTEQQINEMWERERNF